jgi:hypothetical protein
MVSCQSANHAVESRIDLPDGQRPALRFPSPPDSRAREGRRYASNSLSGMAASFCQSAA